MARPGKLRLLGRPFSVRYLPEKEMPDAVGQCHGELGLIDIRTGQIPIEEADTVLHEIFHAILYCQGREYGGRTEETYVRALATGLMGVLKDNPKLAEWLLAATQNKNRK